MISVTDWPYSAKGNARLVTDAAMTSGSATLTSATASFQNTDLGATIYVYGAGAAGATLVGTVTARASATQITVSLAASTTVSGARMWLGADDTAAIQAAINAAGTSGNIVYFPPLNFLVTGNLSLQNCQIQGVGIGDSEVPYSDNGSQIWQANTSNPMFKVDGSDVTVTGLTFFYPDQTGTSATPTAYAPTLQASTTTSIANLTVDNCQFTNAYTCLKIVGTASILHGRIIVTRVRAYGLLCFLQGEYIADVVQVSDCEITTGIWQGVALVGNQYPAKWTMANGNAFTLNQKFDGLFINNTLVYGYKYGVYAISTANVIDFLSLDQVHFDGCQYGVYCTASISNCKVIACNFYCQNGFDGTAVGHSIFVNSASLSDLIVSACHFEYAAGSHILVQGDVLAAQVIGCRFKYWAQQTGLATDQYGVVLTNAPSAQAVVSGCTFFSANATYSIGIGFQSGGRAQIVGNEVYNCKTAIHIPASGYFVITGNAAHNTGATYGCVLATAGSYNALVQTGNSWDVTTAGQISTLIATLAFTSAIAANSSASLTVTVAGAVTNDVIALGLPASGAWTGKVVFQAWVSASNTVTVAAHNITTASVTPGSMSIRINVLPRG